MSERLAGKTVAIVAANEFEDIELEFPLLRLSEEGASIVLVPVKAGTHPRPASPEKPVTGRYGTPIPPDVMTEGNRFTLKELEELRVGELDAVLLPGGFSPDQLRIREDVLDFITKMNEAEKVIAAICHGPQVLISAGLVQGLTVTSYEAVKDDLQNAGAHYVDRPAVRDGNIVTGRVPDDLPQFCGEIVAALED